MTDRSGLIAGSRWQRRKTGRDRAIEPAGQRGCDIVIRQVCFAAALFLAGCAVSPDLFCDIVDTSGPTPSHQCNELHTLDATQEKDAEDACPKLGGVIVDACSTTGQIGTCALSVDGLTQKIHFYPGGGLTAADHEATCKQLMGTWTGS